MFPIRPAEIPPAVSRPHYLSSRRRMRVIGRDPLTRALDEAVVRGLDADPTLPDSLDRAQVQRIVRREFGRLVRERADSVSSVPKSALLAEMKERDASARKPEVPEEPIENGGGRRRTLLALLRQQIEDQLRCVLRGIRSERPDIRRFLVDVLVKRLDLGLTEERRVPGEALEEDDSR